MLQLFQCFGKLVRAAGAAALAVDAFEAGDYIGLIHSLNESTYSLKVSVAAAGVADAPYHVPLKFNVYLAGTDYAAGLEGSPSDATFGLV